MMHPFKVYEDIILTEVSFLSRYISRMEPFKTVWGITFLAASFGFIKSAEKEPWFHNKAKQQDIITGNYLRNKENLVSVAKQQTHGGS